MRRLLILLFCLCMIFTAVSAEDNICVHDSFFPEIGNCGYDAQRYSLNITWTENEGLWSVQETILLTAQEDLNELHLDFTPAYTLSELQVNGLDTEFELTEDDLTIFHNFKAGAGYVIEAAFSGLLQRKSIFDDDGVNESQAGEPFCIISEPHTAHHVFICNDHPADKAYFDMTITVPAKYTPAANGSLIQITEADGSVTKPSGDYSRMNPASDSEGTVTFRYESQEALAPYLQTLSVAVYDLKQTVLSSGRTELDFVSPEMEQSEKAWHIAEQVPEILAWLETLLGDYPFSEIGSIFYGDSFGGALEAQGRSLYDTLCIDETTVVHENSHQWIGDWVSIADWSDLWIKEGFATFMEAFWAGHENGEAGFHQQMRNFYLRLAEIGHAERTPKSVYEDYCSYFSGMDGWNSISLDAETAENLAIQLCGSDTLPLGTVTGAEEFFTLLGEKCERIELTRDTVNAIFDVFPDETGRNDFLSYVTFRGPKAISNNTTSMYSYGAYQGGSLVYYALYQKLGDEVFWNAMRTIISEYGGGTISTAQWIDCFSTTAGEDLTAFINGWLTYDTLPPFPGPEEQKP